ncbi:DUF6351 family protein [Blastococcus sp. VKM Ac-2987]|uniref:DUF6351 family protein n=1 Tax=Blastococcus sp. VKM Ac-2987 TaxID=3004141 RepID=UPI0022AB6F01|nr:DUF6351 family protein [Blastococcus sp. VKM Ac-2987]MCZ2860132.1 DUF6351 family protein [Blastococcus sp. VKM Ac-2987]
MRPRPILRRPLRAAGALATATVIVVTGAVAAPVASAGPPVDRGSAKQQPSRLAVSTLSTAADMVSGGDVLVRVDLPPNLSAPDVTVLRNGEDVTRAFRPAPDGRSLTGLVTGLELGTNELVAQGGRDRAATLTVVNHPAGGPIFSGPQQMPYACTTPEWGLVPADEGRCSGVTEVDYRYRTDYGEFAPLPPGARPDDLVETTTSTGERVPYIVRVETGTLNRAVYQFAVLDDPATPEPDPWTDEPGWNQRLVYTYGGGCRSGYHQGTETGDVMQDLHLSQGYAVASSTLNVNNTNCNDVVSAETTMMVKERVIEQIGVPLHTIGWGASGGAMQQYEIAQNYPGLLDGITPTLSFPDATTYFIGADDCRVLLRPYLNANEFTDEQKEAISGYAEWETCDVQHAGRPGRLDPEDCDPAIPEAWWYDAVTNPDGARCSIYDGMKNIFGTDPETGFARRPHDNVGVQYGLEAVNSGQITPEQFLDLNAGIGGYDIDMNWTPERVEGDVEAIRAAYSTGRTTSGAGGLATVPIIDARPYLDLAANFHDSVRSFSMRDRLIKANGHADNQVILRADPSVYEDVEREFLAQMDAWLTALGEDRSDAPEAVKVLRAKPDDLVDACWTADGTKIEEPATYSDEGRCNELFPPHSGPRIAAGGPLSDDVWKCQLTPVDPSGYAVSFTDAELDRLREIFPDGVCDWSKPSIGFEPLAGTWLSFADVGTPATAD